MIIPDYAKKNFIITEDDTEQEILIKKCFLNIDRVYRELQDQKDLKKIIIY